MNYFEVAASLLNRFHPPIVDRDNALEVIQEIDRCMNIENSLGDSVIRNNYNRQRAILNHSLYITII